MVWVPSTKVHARVVLSKHVRQKKFFTLIKLCKVESVTEIRAITVWAQMRGELRGLSTAVHMEPK